MDPLNKKLRELREMYGELKKYSDELSSLRKKIRIHISVNAESDMDWQITWEGMIENLISISDDLNSYVKSLKEEHELLTKSCAGLEALDECEAKEAFRTFLSQHMNLIYKEARIGYYNYTEMMRSIAVTQKLLDEST